MKPVERNDEFERAYKAIVGNERLEVLTIKGIKGNTNAFSEPTNRITEICISLTDAEIDNIVRSFNETLRKKSDFYIEKYDLSKQESQYLKQGVKILEDGKKTGRIFDSKGVKEVASFVRARKKLHEAEPRTLPAFYFENHLDARHKIDLIEIIEGDEGAIVNLIQIKSHEYTRAEIEKYTEAHKDWINGYVVDLETFESRLTSEPSDREALDGFMRNVESLENVFLDIMSGDIPFSKDILFEKLGLGGRPNVEKFWILKQYLPFLEEEVLKLEKEGYIDGENRYLIQKTFVEIHEQIQKVENKKKDLTGIAEVYSICATGSREVSKVKIFEDKGDKRKAIRIEK